MYCTNCTSKNHTAADCPEKSKNIDLLITVIEKKKNNMIEEEVPIEEEFHNFMKELKNEKE